MSNPSWDIIATASAGADAAWFAWRMAHSLSRRRGGRVTLYLDDVAAIARRAPGIDPALSIQPVDGFHLADHKTLCASMPADDCLVVFDSIVPGGYSLLRSQRGCKPWHFRLWAPGAVAAAREEARATMPGAIGVANGSAELGLVHPEGDAWQQRADLRLRLRSVGRLEPKSRLPYDRVAGERVITVLPHDAAALDQWVPAWLQSPWPLRVLLPITHLSDDAFSGMWRQGPNLLARQLTISPLPDLTWREMDEVIWSSDLVMSDQRDIAMRAMVSGTPVVTSLPPPTALARRACGVDVTTRIEALGAAWSLNQDVAGRWLRFCACWNDVQAQATKVAGWLRELPDLADTLAGSRRCEPVRSPTPARIFLPLGVVVH